VELFLNFAWLVLSATLAIYWTHESRHAPLRSGRPDRKLQLLTLALLIIILLPVISITDDMQAMSAAEIEHVTRRADLLPNSDQPADFIFPQDANVLLDTHLFNLKTFARVEPSIENAHPQLGLIRQIANRPPPVTA
jgi:hypothetical protein